MYDIILPESEEGQCSRLANILREMTFCALRTQKRWGFPVLCCHRWRRAGSCSALIGMRSDNIVFSHETALNLHGLSNRIPARPSITIPYGGSVPHSIASAVNAYRIRPELHDLGRGTEETFMGNEVACYDRERTICDIIRSYSRMDVETYANAIRNYAGSREKNIPQLVSYAQAMGIERKVLKVMEVLV